MPYKDKEKEKTHRRKYYVQNKKHIKTKTKEWALKNREKRLNYHKEYRIKHCEVLHKKQKEKIKIILLSWATIVPSKTLCQICKKEIYLNNGDKSTAIHFDHRTGNEIIKKDPTHWLRSHPRTPENEKIWLSCNFGMLCHRCNRCLPFEDRINWVKGVNEYVIRKGELI